jgi:hypothetical protein
MQAIQDFQIDKTMPHADQPIDVSTDNCLYRQVKYEDL